MRERLKTTVELEIPESVTVSLDENMLHVSGPNGKVERYLPPVDVTIKGNKIVLSSKNRMYKNTAMALIKSAIKGVIEGFEKKLKILYSHFPMTIDIKGKEIFVKNFIGEKNPRIAKIVGDTKVDVKKDVIELSGPDNYSVGQTAANLIQITKILRKDPRRFQDGIYLLE